MKIRSIRIEGFTFLIILIVVAFTYFNAYIRNLSLPSLLNYVAPNATDFLVTSPLNNVWDTGKIHLDSLFSYELPISGKRSKLQKKLVDIRKNLEKSCIGIYDSSDLHNVGIDGSRGLALATYDASILTGDAEKILIVIPVEDRFRFEKFLFSVDNSSSISIKSKKQSQQVERYLISVKSLNNGTLCSDVYTSKHSRRVVEVTDTKSYLPNKMNTLQLRFSSNELKEASLKLTCQVEFKDKSLGDCECTVNSEKHKCEDEIIVNKSLDSTAIPIIDGHQYDGYFVDESFYLAYPTPDTAVLSTNQKILTESLTNTDRNIDYFRNWDALVYDFKRLLDNASIRDAIFVGAIKGPNLPISTHIPFSLRLSPQLITFASSYKLDTWNISFLKKILSAAKREETIHSELLEPAGIKLNITDQNIHYYLSYFFDYIKGTKDFLSNYFGKFDVVFEQLSQTKSLKSIGLYVFEASEKIPEMVLAIRVNRDQADNIVSKLQNKLRLDRDQEILNQAMLDYSLENSSGSQIGSSEQSLLSIEKLLSSKKANTKINYIVEETYSTWQYYKIENGKIKLESGKFSKAVFDNNNYRIQLGKYQLDYIMPPITQNDLTYRFNNDDLEKLDKEGMLKGDYRMQSSYVTKEGLLLIANGTNTLTSLLNSSVKHTESGNTISNDSIANIPKVKIDLDVEWFIDQGLLHDDNDIVDIVRNYIIEADEYQSLSLNLQPNKEQNGLYATATLRRKQ